MKSICCPLGTGSLVGVIYNDLNARSPARSLVDLRGILIGEQVTPGREMVRRDTLAGAGRQAECTAMSSVRCRGG
jgi:XapX domain-containing protein